MTVKKRERVIAILGPTASGKTALAVQLAKRLGTEIISGDSMLVYRGFDIGTAKPDEDERGGVRHALVDILDPCESFSVSDFQRLAAAEITAVNRRGRIPLLVGGTGLYVKALLEGYEFNRTAGDMAYRQSLEALAEDKGRQYVHDMLAEVDPAAARRLHVNDFRRVIRALEVAQLGKENISDRRFYGGEDLRYEAWVVGLRWERPLLYARINERVRRMVNAGWEDEVRTLLAAGVSRRAPAMKGIGYREMAALVAGEMCHEDAVAAIQKATRRFAKRQFTWYRKMPYIHWYEADHMPLSLLLEKVFQDVAGFFT
ncbi:MAG: tRNA (adenosine(37)-N6)-dimethylallyltransferase MiaA [Schwartzia sp. (in: firmicutes)]